MTTLLKKLQMLILLCLLFIPVAYALDITNMMTVISQYTGKPDWIRGTNQTGEEFIFENLTVTNIEVENLESNLDATGYNITADWGFMKINWSDIQNKFITAVDDIYIYMSGTTATLNETKLNNSIVAISSLLNVNHSNSTTYWDGETSQADLNVNSSTYWDEETSQADLNVNSSTYWNANSTNYLGSDTTGESPDQNRNLSTGGVTFVYLDGLLLQNSTQYTASNNVITFLVNVKDTHRITVVN